MMTSCGGGRVSAAPSERRRDRDGRRPTLAQRMHASARGNFGGTLACIHNLQSETASTTGRAGRLGAPSEQAGTYPQVGG
eukprot:597705-Prymnesium_polylepis.2